AQTAALTNTVADRDELIGQVIVNLNSVLGSLAEQSGQFAKGVDKLAEFTAGLAARRTDVGVALSAVDAASVSITDLLRQGRAPLKEAVAQTDRAAAIAVADHEYLDRILNTLPDAYQALARQGLYGDYFSFYVCDLVLKLNGKGGQPVYVKVAGQSSGRCAPR
ncbi:MAG: MCE family protein, partial [Actinomycetota bacterium]|nr:MCE family protein [Actinomycetota bacterium]